MRNAMNLAVALAAMLAGAGAGCDLRGFTADSTAELLHAGAPQFNTLEDLQFAEESAPANLVTMESVWRVSPRNQDVLVELVAGYTSYAFGFLEDHAEVAELDDQPDRADYFRARARAAYLRGRAFGYELLAQRAGGERPERAIREGLEPFRRYIARLRDRADVPALYWTGNAWLSWIQQSLDDPNALLDLPFAMALIDRAAALDPGYNYGGVHMVRGLYYAGTPRELGGRPDLARAEFEAAIRGANRRYLIYQVMYARAYAVQVQDRALYRRLLDEVIAAGDVMPSERLSNQVAKRRAMRYLRQLDALFAPDEPPPPAQPTPPPARSGPRAAAPAPHAAPATPPHARPATNPPPATTTTTTTTTTRESTR